jgi:alkylation response protein AidB-like acyl-CoA dehydrogenase
MRFTLTSDQHALLDAARTLLARHAGAGRARALGGDAPGYDVELETALIDAGFAGCARDPDVGALSAALIVEATAEALGVIAIGARALVAPGLNLDPPAGPIALMVAGHAGPVRFAGDGGAVLVACADEARLVRLTEADVEPVVSRYGYPLGRLLAPDSWAARGEPLGSGSGARLRAWWRTALAVELVGTMRAALDLTLEHVRHRHQFGKPIGSFQAVQHRLAETTVLVEGSRLLALESAWLGAADESAAISLTHASGAARRVLYETHQLTGATGFAVDNDLHLCTMRIPALLAEADSAAFAEAAVAARWPALAML